MDLEATVALWSVLRGNTTPLPTPWWSGVSRWAPLSRCVAQPRGLFWHLSPASYGAGDQLFSPADRCELPRFEYARSRLLAGLPPFSFDEHAVYVYALDGPRELHAGTSSWGAYQVQPLGLLWPDPEAPFGESWCCRQALVVRVVRPAAGLGPHRLLVAEPGLRPGV